MLPFKHLSHVSVVVSDLAKARAFYGDVLGLTEIARPEFGFPGVWYSLGGDLQLHVIVNEAWPFRPVEHDRFEIRAPHFALFVEDADDILERLVESGHPVHDYYSRPTGFRQLFVHDPDGNMVEFIGPSQSAGPGRPEQRPAEAP